MAGRIVDLGLSSVFQVRLAKDTASEIAGGNPMCARRHSWHWNNREFLEP